MQVYDACVEALTGAGLIVIPNCHLLDPGWCCSEDDGNGLWFNTRWPAARFFAAWQDMAARYKPNSLVAAMDITNEPRQARVGWRVLTPTWGTRPKTDIAAMYTALGNLIHRISPHVLIICEGLHRSGWSTRARLSTACTIIRGSIPGASPGRRTSIR
jgi:endoglucanase